ncbi:MAG: hypothetical protein E7541_05730 [Ruminococcaceae bacterium]|nr:hypothetical protein [Oscillospiraceae bacterium]
MTEYIALCDQLGRRVTVHDTRDWSTPVWEWSCEDPLFRNVAGVKLRRHPVYGPVMLTCASDGYVAMVSYPEGKLLWETHAKGNLHSVELLPDGRIALAASTGSYLRLYSPNDTTADIDFPDAHGALYDPQRNTLWVLGSTFLREYDPDTLQVAGNQLDFSSIDAAGHDLAPYYGDTNRLWITTQQGIQVYDKEQNAFVPDAFIPLPHTKGVGNTPYSHTVFYLRPNGVHLPWCTDRIRCRDHRGEQEIPLPGMAVYKLRVFCEAYQ